MGRSTECDPDVVHTASVRVRGLSGKFSSKSAKLSAQSMLARKAAQQSEAQRAKIGVSSSPIAQAIMQRHGAAAAAALPLSHHAQARARRSRVSFACSSRRQFHAKEGKRSVHFHDESILDVTTCSEREISSRRLQPSTSQRSAKSGSPCASPRKSGSDGSSSMTAACEPVRSSYPEMLERVVSSGT